MLLTCLQFLTSILMIVSSVFAIRAWRTMNTLAQRYSQALNALQRNSPRPPGVPGTKPE